MKCVFCGKEFERRLAQEGSPRNKFCSSLCQAASEVLTQGITLSPDSRIVEAIKKRRAKCNFIKED